MTNLNLSEYKILIYHIYYIYNIYNKLIILLGEPSSKAKYCIASGSENSTVKERKK
jgi:hypothetical protein